MTEDHQQEMLSDLEIVQMIQQENELDDEMLALYLQNEEFSSEEEKRWIEINGKSKSSHSSQFMDDYAKTSKQNKQLKLLGKQDFIPFANKPSAKINLKKEKEAPLLSYVKGDDPNLEYAVVNKVLGGRRFQAYCFDGRTRTVHRTGNSKHNYIQQGSFILVYLKCHQPDVLYVFSEKERLKLLYSGELTTHDITTQLPPEICFKIFDYLEKDDLPHIAKVSLNWSVLVSKYISNK